MSIKYLCILGIISVLQAQIPSKAEIQIRKKVSPFFEDSGRSQGIIKVHPVVKLNEENRVIHIHRPHKKIIIHKSPKLPSKLKDKKSNKGSPISSTGQVGLNSDRQLKKASEGYPIYLKHPKLDKKHHKSPNLSSYSSLRSDKDHKKIKRSHIHEKRPKIVKKHQGLLKGSSFINSPKRNNHQRSDSPSSHMQPPEIGQKSQYKHYKMKKPLKKVILRKKLRKPNNYVIDKLSGEENRQENYPNYVRDHDPKRQVAESSNNDDRQKEESEEENSADDDRVDFHIHGHDGPKSYVFGYDTGKGFVSNWNFYVDVQYRDNRQFRWEQRHENGTVTGQYGYYDPRGKFKKIFYRSDPFLGYQQNDMHEEENARNLIETENNEEE